MGLFSRRKPEERASEFPFVLPTANYLQPLQGPLNVSADTALGIPALWRCATIISDSIASLPLVAYRQGNRVSPQPSILTMPDRTMTRMDMIASTVLSLLIDGNAYWLLGDRDELGYPRQAVLLAPDAVNIRTAANGATIAYQVAGQVYDPEDILHIRGLTFPGSVKGLSVISHHRRTLGLAIAGEDCASELYNAGGLPVGVLEVDADITKEEADALKAGWISKNGGRNRTPAVLGNGIVYKPLSFSASDLELIDSRRYSAQQVCTLFGVPPHMVGVAMDGNSMTYSNVTQDSIQFVRYTLRPWLSRVEQALSMLLPRGQDARFILDDMLRADTATRYAAYETGIRAGFLTAAEVRGFEDLTDSTPPEATDNG
jgi:HK97 family phage portal protein